MTTTTTAVSKGSTETTTAGKPERLTGMAQVREAEAYHTASVMHDAIFEADRLCSAIYRAVTDAYFSHVREDQADTEARSATETAESPRSATRLPKRCTACTSPQDHAAAAHGQTTSSPF